MTNSTSSALPTFPLVSQFRSVDFRFHFTQAQVANLKQEYPWPNECPSESISAHSFRRHLFLSKNHKRDSPGMCSYVWALLVCWAPQRTSPVPVLHRVSDSLAFAAVGRETSFSVSGAPSSASSPVFHNSETPLYKFYLLGGNIKSWTDQRKTWVLVSNLSLLFQTPTSFIPITNFVSFGSGLTHCFSRFLTCVTNISCTTLSMCWQWFWSTINFCFCALVSCGWIQMRAEHVAAIAY